MGVTVKKCHIIMCRLTTVQYFVYVLCVDDIVLAMTGQAEVRLIEHIFMTHRGTALGHSLMSMIALY